jgi:ribosome-associated toxin RatA of RatAB toxin-antitoxin module
MPEICQSERLMASPEVVFEVIAAVERYPEFVPWCTAAWQETLGDGQVLATIEVAAGPFHERLSTRNSLEPPRSLAMELVSGPFRHLHGRWHLMPCPEGTEVTLELDFALRNRLLAMTVSRSMDRVSGRLIAAFRQRVEEAMMQKSGTSNP